MRDLLKLKLHLTKLQPAKHSMGFSNVLLSWSIYFPKERKILYHYAASDNCVVFRWLKDEVVWRKDNWWCYMCHQTFSFPWWTELCYLLLKSETSFSAVILVLTLQLYGILCTYSYFILKFFSFAELLCAHTYLVVHCNMQKQCRGTPKPSWLPGEFFFHNLYPFLHCYHHQSASLSQKGRKGIEML